VKAYLNKHRKGGTLGFTKTDIPVADRPGFVVRISGIGIGSDAVLGQMNQWKVENGFIVPCQELRWEKKKPYFKITTNNEPVKGLLTREYQMWMNTTYDPDKTLPVWSWFGRLFGFEEKGLSYDKIKANFSLDAERRVLFSNVNGKRFVVGEFTTPSLHKLRQMGERYWTYGPLVVKHVVTGDILPYHARESNAGATFQAASQFNCLEFVSPYTTPENGVTIYVEDETQGPACSIAAGPATVYRNYFAEVNGQEGQTRDRQLNNLDILSQLLASGMGSVDGYSPPFEVRGGYTFSTDEGLMKLNAYLETLSPEEKDSLRASIKIGMHSGVQVVFEDTAWTLIPADHKQIVSQVFCSAISCAYSDDVPEVLRELWEPLATLVLEANYEATLWAALINAASLPGASNKVYLTLLGGGVFGNDDRWIHTAMQRALDRFRNVPLEVVIAHYSYSGNKMLRSLQ
jgi:hypothetical protein